MNDQTCYFIIVKKFSVGLKIEDGKVADTMEDRKKVDSINGNKKGNDKKLMLLKDKPIICEKCHDKLYFIGGGRYKCNSCGYEVLDDFGKVKEFLEENGPSPSIIISEKTGVRRDVIELFLEKGRLEIPEGSDYYIKCAKCGCSIRYGRFCPDCTQKLAGGIKVFFNEDMGEKPKSEKKLNMSGKMYFLERNDK